MTDYALVLAKHFSDRLWSLDGDDYNGLTMLDGGSKPTKAKLDSLWPQVKYERDYAAVEAARRSRYQAETDGLFFAAQREGGDLSAWQAAVDAIKADLPYPEMPA